MRYNDATYNIAQCNNSYIFPAMGLGILAAGATRVTDEMFMTAATALMETSPALKDRTASLLPELSDIRSVSRHIAVAVARQAQKDGVAPSTSPDQLQQNIDRNMWAPVYPKIKHV